MEKSKQTGKQKIVKTADNEKFAAGGSNDPLARARQRVILQAAVTIVAVLAAFVSLFTMTAAWYSNVIQMNSLIVTADPWGFDGTVTVGQEAMAARPGDSGVVSVEICNDDSRPADVRVDVSKDNLTENMKKRIYFFVETDTADALSGEQSASDTPQTRQTVRTYLTGGQGYIYRIEAGAVLKLSGEAATEEEGGENGESAAESAPFIQWEWVYDVLGYYVRGTVTETDDGTASLSEEAEYLMPVKYDLDTAAYDEEGRLQTVELTDENGQPVTASVTEYLTYLYENDEYGSDYLPPADEEDGQDHTWQIGGFYAVDVDSDGYGVWLYLCSWPEIQQETAYDTALGTGEIAENFFVDLIFTGQNADEQRAGE